jgi:hypothetical protein
MIQQDADRQQTAEKSESWWSYDCFPALIIAASASNAETYELSRSRYACALGPRWAVDQWRRIASKGASRRTSVNAQSSPVERVASFLSALHALQSYPAGHSSSSLGICGWLIAVEPLCLARRHRGSPDAWSTRAVSIKSVVDFPSCDHARRCLSSAAIKRGTCCQR